MTSDSIAEMVLSVAARSALQRLFASLKKKPGLRVDAELIRARLETYAQRIGKVKTLLSPEELVPIESFYCAPRISFGEYRLVPNRADDFKDQVLIEGIAGHGKSVLLRYLCSRSILNDGRVALFYELRRLDDMRPLAKIVMEDLAEFGFPGNSEGMKKISVESGLEIYLDGFDEIDQKKAIKIDRDIEYFARTYEFARIFVSSRPYVGLSRNSTFNTYKAQYLNEHDVFRLVDKLSGDRDVSETIKKRVKEHEGRVLGLLETPLLVTLLVTQYKQTRQLPEQLSDFYESIFTALFDRHDSFKVPYIRKRRLGINTSTYKSAFQKFCFASLLVEKLDSDVAEKIATWSLDGYASSSASPADFLKDIAEISSLIDEDGGVWSFIHSSVQEYYAAAYLMGESDDDLEERARRLYEKDVVGVSIDQVFTFCRELDGYRFARFVQIPYCKFKLCPLPSRGHPANAELIDWIDNHFLAIEVDEVVRSGGKFFKLIFNDPDAKLIQFYVLNDADPKVWPTVLSCRNEGAPVADLMQFPFFVRRLKSQLAPMIDKYTAMIKDAEVVVARKENGRKDSGSFLDLLLSGEKKK